MEPSWALARKRRRLEERARIVQSIRAFFIARDFLEVETPHRIPANAPEVHIDAEESRDWFLHTSPELCMKRLLAAGYERLFQLCRCWRRGERGSRHLPEFTLLEWYRREADYTALMNDCEKLVEHLVPSGALTVGGRAVSLSPPWERLTVAEAFARHAAVGVEEALAAGTFDDVIALEIEPRLGWEKPVFLCDYPLACGALSRQKPQDPTVAERFELYLAGVELANAFSELTDAAEQARRFAGDEKVRRQQGKPPYPAAAKFLAELATLPAAAGIALGVDRLVMLLTGAGQIDEVVAFTPEDL